MLQTIKIESILGGHAPTSHFAGEGQFLTSIGIDPGLRSSGTFGDLASGLLNPIGSAKFSSDKLSAFPMWLEMNPKNVSAYCYDSAGEVYSMTGAFNSLTALSALSPSTGNGMAYYDNYLYCAKNTDIARYGPLNGSPTWDTQFWDATISAQAMSAVTYPVTSQGFNYYNHVMHRHSDNKLYIADVSASNEGILNYIKTSRTSVEGDTNNGSTYGALKFPYGFWPTAIESYGTDLAIALHEGTNSSSSYPKQTNAKIAFWDTTSTSYNKITYVEFPDPIIAGLKNVNGVLYVASGQVSQNGFRISRFVGGYTFEEVYYTGSGEVPLQGAMDGNSNRLLLGAYYSELAASGCVYSYGLQQSNLGQGLFNTMSIENTSGVITALKLMGNDGLWTDTPIIGWSTGTASAGFNYLAKKSLVNYTSSPCYWWSQIFRVGQPFQIKKIRIPLAATMAANMTITAKVYTDDGNGTTFTMPTINNTNYPSAQNVVLRTDSSKNIPKGEHNFFLELKWTGTVALPVGLPITIEIETLDD